jgi:hypothetical protein
MQRRASFVLFLLALCMFTSCARWPQVTGFYTDRLTYSDILQIRALVREDPRLRRPVTDISIWQPGEAGVCSGHDPYTAFTVRKKNGRWIVDAGSIEERRAIIL